MMAILDELRDAATQAISAGANAARGQGIALRADFENFIGPQLEGVLIHIADISDDFAAGNIGAEQAADDLRTQLNRVQSVVLAAAELALLAVQIIINAVLDAIKAVVNAATTRAGGIALL
jgi:hypothetical protein